MSTRKTLTTSAGIPVADNRNSLTAGPRGPLLIQDWQLFEKHAHFNRERIPERVVHAKGSAAYGTFTVSHDISQYTKAKVFSAIGKKTEVLLRFSTVAGERDGAMRFDGNGGSTVNYEPNSFDGPKEDLQFREPPLKVQGDADRYDHREGDDDYTQAGNLFRLMNGEQRARLIAAIVGAMKDVPTAIQVRQVGHFLQADRAYGDGVAKGLGLDPKKHLLCRGQ